MRANSWRKKFIPVEGETSLEDFRGRRGNILVIAPHPDDDVLGAGGTMAAASAEGKGVFSVYITDGRGSPRKDKNISDDEMATRRQKEALSALQAVGAVGGFFLKRGREELEGEMGQKTGKELREIFQFIQPEEIFLSGPYERHITHQRCTRLSIEALRAVAGLKTTLLAYSLWGSFWGEKRRVVRDISPFIKKKVQAVLAHASQIDYKNYQQGIMGKNNYEAIFWESHEVQKAAFVEIFMDMTELIEKKDLTLESFMRQDFEAFIQKYSISPIPPNQELQ
ncbi:MAG: PIG-L family deacetylase [Deltaproteobacteria bacterium]|nr:PIG-L family deacetylase [Deltaproteobacteria bacterium]